MTSLKLDFNLRCAQIRAYLILLTAVERTSSPGTSEEEALKVMKSAAYLLFYNLIESTMRGVYVELFDKLNTEGIEFDQLINDLRTLVWKNAKRPAAEKLLPLINKLSKDVIHASFDKEAIFSGNVDARKIRDSLREIGLPPVKLPADRNNTLLAIKTARNQLAHGYLSFGEVGRNATATQLEASFVVVEKQLNYVLQKVEAYLTSKAYAVA
jgi:MAE_28990/MAE_18760-like HEPN